MILASAAQPSSPSLWPATIALISAVLVAGIGILYNLVVGRRDRRRNLYSDAYRSAMAWREMVYRVRRRSEGQEAELLNRFHALQEEISYNEGWIKAECPPLGRAYCDLVAAVKAAAAPGIKQGWAEPIRPVGEHARDDDDHPDVSAASESFLKDVRDHLSPWPWKRIGLRRRDRKRRDDREKQEAIRGAV